MPRPWWKAHLCEPARPIEKGEKLHQCAASAVSMARGMIGGVASRRYISSPTHGAAKVRPRCRCAIRIGAALVESAFERVCAIGVARVYIQSAARSVAKVRP